MDNQQEPAPQQDWSAHMKPKTIAKFIIGALLVYVIAAALLSLMSSPRGVSQNTYMAPMAPSVDGVMMEMGMDMDDAYYGEEYGKVRSTVPASTGGGTGSYDETAYETQQYHVYIQSKAYDPVCDTIESWKPEPSVIFEHSSRGNSLCSYRFKVERERAPLILAELEKFDPRDLSEQTEVIKRQLTEYTSELQILQEREALLEQTLVDVTAAYDELVQYSKDAKDAETLAVGIEGKLKYIERLSRERASVAAQLESLSRRTAELVDRVDYVYFNVDVVKYAIVDGETLKDTWVYKMQELVIVVNGALQMVTIGLLMGLLYFAVFVLYFTIFLGVILFIVKNAWREARRYWNK